MRWIMLIAAAGAAAMAGILAFAFARGDFAAEGSRLLAMPWGIVSLVDLYTGFALFSAWIVYRERALLPSLIWVVLMMVLGFFTASVYTLLALRSSGGDWKRFWMGHRTPTT